MKKGKNERVSTAEREMVLIKVHAPPGEIRTELTNLSNIFRARILDVGDTSCTIAITGDVGKVCFSLPIGRKCTIQLLQT